MTRRSIPSALAFIVPAALILSACATAGEPMESYGAATQRLAADCQARGGILQTTGGQTGRPETDNICKITGGASRLTSGGR